MTCAILLFIIFASAAEYGFKGTFTLKSNDIAKNKQFGYYTGSIHYYQNDSLSYREMQYNKNGEIIIEKYITSELEDKIINIKSVSYKNKCIYINWNYDKELLPNIISSINPYFISIIKSSNVPVVINTKQNKIEIVGNFIIEIPTNIFNDCELAESEEDINCINSDKPCAKDYKMMPTCNNSDVCSIVLEDYITQECLYKNACDYGNKCLDYVCDINTITGRPTCTTYDKTPEDYNSCDKYTCDPETGIFEYLEPFDCKAHYDMKRKYCYTNISCNRIKAQTDTDPNNFCDYDNSLCSCESYIHPDLNICQRLIVDESITPLSCDSIVIVDILPTLNLCARSDCEQSNEPFPSVEQYKKITDGITTYWRIGHAGYTCQPYNGCLKCNTNPKEYIKQGRSFDDPLCDEHKQECIKLDYNTIYDYKTVFKGCYEMPKCNPDKFTCSAPKNLCVSTKCKISSCKTTIINGDFVHQCIDEPVDCAQKLIDDNVPRINECYEPSCSDINGCQYVLNPSCTVSNSESEPDNSDSEIVESNDPESENQESNNSNSNNSDIPDSSNSKNPDSSNSKNPDSSKPYNSESDSDSKESNSSSNQYNNLNSSSNLAYISIPISVTFLGAVASGGVVLFRKYRKRNNNDNINMENACSEINK